MEMGAYHKDNSFHYYGDFTNVCIKVNQTEILIPNMFTPDQDGATKGFEIKGLECLADNNFYIVNRWGQEVYKNRNYKNGWTAEGLKEGSYYYLLMIKETESSEWKAFKGYIILINAKK